MPGYFVNLFSSLIVLSFAIKEFRSGTPFEIIPRSFFRASCVFFGVFNFLLDLKMSLIYPQSGAFLFLNKFREVLYEGQFS